MLQLIHGRDYFSPSQLKKLAISLASFQEYLTGEKKESSEMDLGTLVHCLVLENHLFFTKFIVLDDSSVIEEIGGARPKSTKAYAEFLARFNDEAAGRQIISVEMYDTAVKIYDRMLALNVIQNYFTDGQAEKEVTGTATYDGIDFPALCRVDYLRDDICVDLKTTSKPLDKFKWDADAFGYDIQASLTNRLTDLPFVLVVVQTVAPFDVGIFSCSDAFMQRGEFKIENALKRYENYDLFENFELFHYEL